MYENWSTKLLSHSYRGGASVRTAQRLDVYNLSIRKTKMFAMGIPLIKNPTEKGEEQSRFPVLIKHSSADTRF